MVKTANNFMHVDTGGQDGYKRLACAVLLAAFRDLSDRDPLTALDALGWLLWGDSVTFLDALGMSTGEPLAIMRALQIGGKRNVIHKNSGPRKAPGQSDRRHDTPGAGALQGATGAANPRGDRHGGGQGSGAARGKAGQDGN